MICALLKSSVAGPDETMLYFTIIDFEQIVKEYGVPTVLSKLNPTIVDMLRKELNNAKV